MIDHVNLVVASIEQFIDYLERVLQPGATASHPNKPHVLISLFLEPIPSTSQGGTRCVHDQEALERQDWSL